MGFAIGVLGALTTAFGQHVIGKLSMRPASSITTPGWSSARALAWERWRGTARKASSSGASAFRPDRPGSLFDQLDFILGALILIAPRSELSLGDLAIVLSLTFAGHIVVNHVAYWLGIRDVRW